MKNSNKKISGKETKTVVELSDKIENFFWQAQVKLEIINALAADDNYDWDQNRLCECKYAMAMISQQILDDIDNFHKRSEKLPTTDLQLVK